MTILYRMLGVRGREKAARRVRELLAGQTVEHLAALPRRARDQEAAGGAGPRPPHGDVARAR